LRPGRLPVTHNQCMSTSAEATAIGLRERKKIRTRAAIRDNAMRLFDEQGYAATTVDQIAEAADVSPSTFFRYFPNKEAVVLTDDLDDLMISALRSAPADLSAMGVMRWAFARSLGELSDEALAFEVTRQSLINSVPELRSAMIDDFQRNVDLICTLMSERFGLDRDSLEMKVFAGAVVGAMLAAVRPEAAFRTEVDRVLTVLEKGLVL
jgi:AcrR family transcriptional regulator